MESESISSLAELIPTAQLRFDSNLLHSEPYGMSSRNKFRNFFSRRRRCRPLWSVQTEKLQPKVQVASPTQLIVASVTEQLIPRAPVEAERKGSRPPSADKIRRKLFIFDL
jgi:hypothetical protein